MKHFALSSLHLNTSNLACWAHFLEDLCIPLYIFTVHSCSFLVVFFLSNSSAVTLVFLLWSFFQPYHLKKKLKGIYCHYWLSSYCQWKQPLSWLSQVLKIGGYYPSLFFLIHHIFLIQHGKFLYGLMITDLLALLTYQFWYVASWRPAPDLMFLVPLSSFCSCDQLFLKVCCVVRNIFLWDVEGKGDFWQHFFSFFWPERS